jgi:cytoskeletal protein CcmA (bactofilin family)
MSLAMAIMVFIVLTLALVVLPFVPAIVEWRKKKDAAPLTVVYASEVDVRHLARGFREYVESRLRDVIDRCRDSNSDERGTLADGTPYVVVGDDRSSVLTAEEMTGRAAHNVILSCGDLVLPEEMMFLPEVYADGTVRGGERNIYRAVLAEEEIRLEVESTSLRWLHATRSVLARSDSVLFGRASADQLIRLERGCRFERLHAPRIEFCFEAEADEFAGGMTYRESALLRPRDLPNPVEIRVGRWLIDGNVEIPPGKIVRADLVITGKLWIRPGVHIVGSIKSHKDMRLEKGVEIDGSVVCGENMHIGDGCRLYGPVMAERTINIGAGAIFGTAARPTTVSAENINVEPGAVAHGTVWAHGVGRVAGGRRVSDPNREEK